MASQDLASCMNCFTLQASVREDKALAFSRKRPATLIGQPQQASAGFTPNDFSSDFTVADKFPMWE